MDDQKYGMIQSIHNIAKVIERNVMHMMSHKLVKSIASEFMGTAKRVAAVDLKAVTSNYANGLALTWC